MAKENRRLIMSGICLGSTWPRKEIKKQKQNSNGLANILNIIIILKCYLNNFMSSYSKNILLLIQYTILRFSKRGLVVISVPAMPAVVSASFGTH